jgi:hypothetical protein
MRRILLVLSVAALMAAMMLAMAVPAFADPEGVRGHHTTSGNLWEGCDWSQEPCSGSWFDAGGSGSQGGGGGGLETGDQAIDGTIREPAENSFSIQNRGGNSDSGGGYCTTDYNYPGDGIEYGGVGPRCEPPA